MLFRSSGQPLDKERPIKWPIPLLQDTRRSPPTTYWFAPFLADDRQWRAGYILKRAGGGHVQLLQWWALGTVEALRPVQKPVQHAPHPPQLLVQRRHSRLNFQLFAMTGLFRNQQVAGSTPAGGSNPLKTKQNSFEFAAGIG